LRYRRRVGSGFRSFVPLPVRAAPGTREIGILGRADAAFITFSPLGTCGIFRTFSTFSPSRRSNGCRMCAHAGAPFIWPAYSSSHRFPRAACL
jgi:hypothetical protein